MNAGGGENDNGSAHLLAEEKKYIYSRAFEGS